jgi:putative tricarboxylic transport membrane protein
MRLNDGLLGLILIAFAAAHAYPSRAFLTIPGQHYCASAFPTLIAVGFAGCGLVLVASAIRQRAPLVVWQDWTRDGRGIVNVVATIGAVVFYIVAWHRLGFILTSIPVLVLLLRLFGVGWFWTLTIAIVVPLGMQYLFGRVLLVPLPWGLLAPVRLW